LLDRSRDIDRLPSRPPLQNVDPLAKPVGEPPTLSNLPTASFGASLCVMSRGFQHMT
jgi:hypothetical protein